MYVLYTDGIWSGLKNRPDNKKARVTSSEEVKSGYVYQQTHVEDHKVKVGKGLVSWPSMLVRFLFICGCSQGSHCLLNGRAKLLKSKVYFLLLLIHIIKIENYIWLDVCKRNKIFLFILW